MSKVAVMGGGSMGTAFGMIMADAGSDVTIWAREPVVVEDINTNHRNERFHPGLDLPPSIYASQDAEEVITGASLVVLAIPAQTLRHAPDDVVDYVRANRDSLRVRIMGYDWTLNEQSRGPRSRRPVPR